MFLFLLITGKRRACSFIKTNPYIKEQVYVKKSVTLVYSGKIGFKTISMLIIGKAKSKTNAGYFVIRLINTPESPLALFFA